MLAIFKSDKMIYALCFIVGSLYCAILTYSGFLIQNTANIIFVLLLFLLTYKNLSAKESTLSITPILIQLALLILGIATTAQVIHSPNSFFWAQDSIQSHLPESIKFSEYFKGNDAIKTTMGIENGKATHAFTGALIVLFGVNTFTTVLGQLILKLLTCIVIYNICQIQWNKRVGYVAAAVYAFCPTVIFYNLFFYKEGMVQLMVAFILLFTLKIFLRKKLFYVFPLALAYWILFGERAYLSYILIIPLILMPLRTDLLKPNSRKVVYLIILALLGMILLYLGLFDFNQKVTKLAELRAHYSSFSDVQNKYNYEIPLPVAFIKILLSPYFTFNKFNIFSDTSLLLIWGSFVNQAIILASLCGFFIAARRNLTHVIVWIPFIIFLSFAAYISPWSGRLRDSFYPLIACYAAYFIYTNHFTRKILRIHS